MYYAGAGLSQSVWDELQELAVESCGERILMYTGLGSTETGPSAMFPYWEEDRAGHVRIHDARRREGRRDGAGLHRWQDGAAL